MVGRVRAVDADAGANAQVRYRLRNATDRAGLEAFGVDARSGQIRVRTSDGLDKDRSVSGISVRVRRSLLKALPHKGHKGVIHATYSKDFGLLPRYINDLSSSEQ